MDNLSKQKYKRGYTIPVLVAALGVIGSIGAAWFSASASADQQIYNSRLEQQKIDSIQDQNIGQLQTSVCIQNANMKNIATVLKASFVSDPNCK